MQFAIASECFEVAASIFASIADAFKVSSNECACNKMSFKQLAIASILPCIQDSFADISHRYKLRLYDWDLFQ